jgi:squalene cyclase
VATFLNRKSLLAPVLSSLLLITALPTATLAAEAEPTNAGPAPVQDFIEITPKLEESVDRALAWLAKNQSREGSWGNEGSAGQYPMAMTGLAGLAFLSAGHTPDRGKYGVNVSRALEYVLKHQQSNGLIDSGADGQQMYGHGFAMTFLGEAYGMSPSQEVNERIKIALQKAVKLTQQSQSNNGGWYYSPNSGADEGSVTVTQVQGLRSARNAGIDVPEKVMKNAIEYLHKSQNSDGGIRYSLSGGTSSIALTAAGAEVFMMAGQYNAKEAAHACEYLQKNLDPRRTVGYHDVYTNFYGSQAMFQIGGDYWAHYFTAMRDRLLSSQSADGSWKGDVGSTYSTAIGVLVLCLPFRYLPIFQK